MHDLLKYGLEKFEMLNLDGIDTGLMKVLQPDLIDHSSVSIEEIIAIEEAYKYKADYVYFRRFTDKPSVPQVYIYDFTDELLENINLIRLHQRLYCSGRVPMFFVFTNKDVIIFNCFDKPAKGNQLVYKPLTTIALAAKFTTLFQEDQATQDAKFKAFSGKSFDNGSFWENSPFSSSFKFKNSAYENLLSELKQSLKHIIEQQILPAKIARKMMVISILIKYLEERTDENNNSVFPKANQERIIFYEGVRKQIKFENSFFSRFSKDAKGFTDVLSETGAALKLIDYLAKHFNGGVFELSQDERVILSKSDLKYFALFLEGKLQGNQFVFWRLYSFNDLPVELISNIYEEFLEKRPGVVYTPPYLVNFLLDEALPLKGKDIDSRILDPSCGSGVFLVGAYRRLIYRWRQQNNWKRPSLDVLKALLKNNIFGCDIDPDAVNLSIFSLSLALCDELTPLQIWEDLQFDNLLNKNIYPSDFFKLINERVFPNGFFDLIIGNPPFEAKITENAAIVEANQLFDRTINSADVELKSVKIKLPDNQISLLFLEQSIKLCKADKTICLIQPSGPFLYNNNSTLFRKYLFDTYRIDQIIDFTLLRSVLFGNATIATCAVFFKNTPATISEGTYHIIVNRTKSSTEKQFFEIDGHDFYYIPHNLLSSSINVWKANLTGLGKRVNLLLDKLSEYNKLSDCLINKLEAGWFYGEGFMRGGEDDYVAPYLTNQPGLLSKNFSSRNALIEPITDEYFVRPRKERLYKGPLCLIKEVIESESGELPVFWSDEDLAFDSRILGISAPKNDQEDLFRIYKYLNKYKKLISFHISLSSSQSLINYSSAIRADDIYNLPYDHELEIDDIDEIIINDFSDYVLDFLKNGESAVMARTNADEQQLEMYSQIFCETLNLIYKNLNRFKSFETESYYCLPFYFGKEPTIDFDDTQTAEHNLSILVKKSIGTNQRITRTLRIYEGNVIFIIKPKKLRYWLKSMALRDADETFSDLRRQGF
ncbi:N-6 DNA methylase [Mucilaginibacter sp. Bleaf8]|uniref:HsdM family class I SAM-dependent methyltransferase n=1 Tax=Mucilaginibacter sp. Bleaf8 TaxID=2834430 RepID=UPI001BCD729D|nr:N-6 DNA methylase [Mucilaginibacter sp. Bleaf8]MBS7565391.1 N-6 DNA methylase [Mucilaginibacter sp. Bleaf8]